MAGMVKLMEVTMIQVTPRVVQWYVFNQHNEGKRYGSLAYARQNATDDRFTVARVIGDKITHMWDWTGRPMQFITHGGDYGEWR